ncbi:amidohydrolase family protein [Kitasatospora griseola]|uniref:amidohydrolase family protein n=1 Tax=Kitasatospora griseola TaxID=2064 RepID=UPI0009F9F1C2|nr:amidohydrolase family protein [Kitasatospora griseola]
MTGNPQEGQTQQNQPGPYDIVLVGGRVVDPEREVDEVLNVGITGGRIAAISRGPLEGTTVIDAEGLVVAPGFIDLHSHGQQLPAAWMQAFDGVTTALELESGLLPIGEFYDNVAAEGRPINYGASVAWTYARIAEKEGLEPKADLVWFQEAFSRDGWQNSLADDGEVERIIARVEKGLLEGGLGIGINGGYAPGYGRKEYHALAKLAAKHKVPTFTHVRYLSVQEPESGFEALGELISLAAATGAHMHICHLNANAGRDVKACVELIAEAQENGVPVTVESYPYGGCSSTVGAEVFRGDWLARWGAEDTSVMELNGEPMTQEKIDELQKNAPGTVVNMHFLHPDDKPEDAELLDLSVLFPGAAIASDAMPWVNKDGTLVEGDVWPLPEGAFAHPRSAGCFSRFLSRWARGADGGKPKVSLVEAIRRTSLIPAQILEESVPQMRGKGRLQVGADADIVVFDLATVQDNATFTEPAQHSTGFRHVIVNGTPIIRDGKELLEQRPGKPVRRARATTRPGMPGTGAAERVEAS